MGLYDRDYARQSRPGSPSASSLSLTTRLIIANVAIWFVFAGSLRWGGTHGGFHGLLYDTFLLHTDQVFARLKLWQPFTAIWFHDPRGLGHVFFNMLFLFFFGRVVEGMIGRREMLRLYLAGGIVAALSLLPLAALAGHPMIGLGASGAIYAIGVFAALRVPNLPVIFLVVPMPLWVMVAFFMVGREVANLMLVHAGVGTSVAHLTGALVGWAYHGWRRARAPGSGADAMASMRKRFERMRAQRDQQSESSTRERVDRLLEKIHREGVVALSDEEKDFLERASRRYGRP